MNVITYSLGWFYYLINCIFIKNHKEVYYLENRNLFFTKTGSDLSLALASCFFQCMFTTLSNQTSSELFSGWAYSLILIPFIFYVSVFCLKNITNNNKGAIYLLIMNMSCFIFVKTNRPPILVPWNHSVIANAISYLPSSLPPVLSNQLFVITSYFFNLLICATILFILKVVLIDCKVGDKLEKAIQNMHDYLFLDKKTELTTQPKNFKIRGHRSKEEKDLEKLF